MRDDTAIGAEELKDELFAYLRGATCKLLQDDHPFKRLLLVFANREAYVELGAAITKAKLDAMWSTSTKRIGKRHHRREFFRQVIMKAILVITNFGEHEYASKYLRELSKSDEEVNACIKVSETLEDTNPSMIVVPDESEQRPP